MEKGPRPDKKPTHLEFQQGPDGRWGLNENVEADASVARRNSAPEEANKLLQEIHFNELSPTDQIVRIKSLIDVLERENFNENVYLIEELSTVLDDLEMKQNKPHSINPRLEYRDGTFE
jgi:23S rRNA C2498 (ribose-2'-O)-methylase RlmM